MTGILQTGQTWIEIIYNLVNLFGGILGWQNFACILHMPFSSNYSLGYVFFLTSLSANYFC